MGRVLRDLQNQSKVRASGKFEATQQEEYADRRHPAAAAVGAGSLPSYNSLHTHPTTSNNYQQTRNTSKRREEEEKKGEKRAMLSKIRLDQQNRIQFVSTKGLQRNQRFSYSLSSVERAVDVNTLTTDKF